MAFLPAILSIGSRFVGKVASTTLGWASTLLFGRVPESRQGVLVGIAFGSLLWLAMLVGVLVPGIGTFLIALVPRPGFISTETMRVAMLIGVLVVPAIVGSLTSWLADPKGATLGDRLRDALRGYPITVAMAVILIFLAGLAVYRKVRSVMHRWTDEHMAIVIKPGAYDAVAEDLVDALTGAGLPVVPRPAPRSMSAPARFLAKVAGPRANGLVPDRMVQLDSSDLKVLIYPSDLMISGTAASAARARAALASKLTTSAAHLTTAANAQAIEDRIAAIGRAAKRVAPADRMRLAGEAFAELEAIDRSLATETIAYDDWEVLYRERLQVERDLLAIDRRREPTDVGELGLLRTLGAPDVSATPPADGPAPSRGLAASEPDRGRSLGEPSVEL
jgi:hypothetical protein